MERRSNDRLGCMLILHVTYLGLLVTPRGNRIFRAQEKCIITYLASTLKGDKSCAWPG